MTVQLEIGQQAPGFSLADSTGKQVSLSDFAGQNVVVYFYPKAATPGCTTEACDFRDSLDSLNAAGYRVVGISPDAPEELAAFANDFALTYPLLADKDHEVASRWGAWGDKVVNGQAMQGILRSTVVVDGEGKVALADYNVAADGHVADLRSRLESM